jgi:hypothetical protein
VADPILERAERRRTRALEIIDELYLTERWSAVGHAVQVGAVAHHLVVSPDIDFEVFTQDTPRIAEGFRVVSALAEHSG